MSDWQGEGVRRVCLGRRTIQSRHNEQLAETFNAFGVLVSGLAMLGVIAAMNEREAVKVMLRF